MAHHAFASFECEFASSTLLRILWLTQLQCIPAPSHPPARVDEDFIPVYLAQSKDEAGREASLKDAEAPLENLAFDELDVTQPAQDTMWAHQWSGTHAINLTSVFES